MKVPQDIYARVTDGLSGMYTHLAHHYDWRVRRDIYRQMNHRYGAQGHAAHGWLAVIAARYVLPIFTSTFPEDTLPQQLVDCAQQVMEKTVSPEAEAVLLLEDQGYMSTGIDCMTWRSRIAYNAEYAGNAAYKALMEARGKYRLLDSTEKLVRGQAVQVFELPENTTPDEVTDRDIAHLAAYCDTAGTAAITFACEVKRFRLDPERLKAFWEWCAMTAFPEAWTYV